MIKPAHRIRLVALDLDGTTLNPFHELNQTTVDAVRAVASRGVKVVLASGRLSYSILPFARRMGLDGVHIGLNGGISFDLSGRLRHKHLLTPEQLALAHEVFFSEGLDPLVFGASGLWVQRASDNVDFLFRSGEPAARFYDAKNPEAIEDPAKVVAVLSAGSRDEHIASLVGPRLHAVRSGPIFFELMPPGVTKGAALAEYMADLGLNKEEVMAVGDSENDASLLGAAGFSVAMGNAVGPLKDQAHAVTESNAEDGVARALHRWILDQ
jgi:Cof subfamily protein (haloacid dehalogenase superfamily)